MNKVNKVNIKILTQENEQGNSSLSFKISGPNIDYVVVNTLRRVIMADIPIYAFDDFKFEKNTSVFHNNYIKLRLRHMPVWSIENEIDFIDYTIKNSKPIIDTTIEEANEDDNVELNIEKNLNLSSLKQLTMYINNKNKTNNITTVSTSDAKFYYGEKQIESPYKIAIPIVKLQPNQEIAFSAITKLGTEEEDAMYSAVCVCYYKEINPNEFDFTVESRGQITEKRILKVGLINIEKRIRNFLKLLSDDNSKVETNDKSGLIIVNNEDSTLGNLISRGMQTHNKIKFAGYNLPHPAAKKVHFHYKINDETKIKDVVKDVVEYYSEIFNNIKKEFV